jgi:hypothetical protein
MAVPAISAASYVGSIRGQSPAPAEAPRKQEPVRSSVSIAVQRERSKIGIGDYRPSLFGLHFSIFSH